MTEAFTPQGFYFKGDHFNVGDIVRITRPGGITIEGPISKVDSTAGKLDCVWLGTAAPWPVTGSTIQKVTLIKRLVVPLPAKDNLYVSGSVTNLSKAGIFRRFQGVWSIVGQSNLKREEVLKIAQRVHSNAGLKPLKRADLPPASVSNDESDW